MIRLSLIILIVLFFTFISCNQPENQTTGKDYNIHNTASGEKNKNIKGVPQISFKETEYNFGTLIQGEKVSYSFMFENTGDGNLIISDVSTSCGCTAPEYSKEPIAPGEKGYVEVVFDSKGRSGHQTQNIKVHTNTQPNITDLKIRCDIVN